MEARALHLAVGCAILGPLPVPAAIARCRELLEHEEQRTREAALRGLTLLTAWAGRFDEARKLVDEDAALLTGIGSLVAVADARSTWGAVELAAGDPAAAQRILREGYKELTAMGEKSMRAILAAELARAVEAQGRFDEAEALTRESEADAEPQHVAAHISWRGVRARICAARGEPAGEAFAREAVALVERTDFLNTYADALDDLSETLRRLGRFEEAELERQNALAAYERKGNVAAATRLREALGAAVPAHPLWGRRQRRGRSTRSRFDTDP